MNCHRCGQEISRFAKTCKYCGAPVAGTTQTNIGSHIEMDRSSVSRNRRADGASNEEPSQRRTTQSRQTRRMATPETEVYRIQGKWSWGAFTFTWIWGLFNGTYIALLALLPMAGFVFKVILGIKGNAWAYQNRKWQSDQHYVDTMKKWNAFGLIGFLAWCLIIIGYASLMWTNPGEIHYFQTTTATEVPVYEEIYEDGDLYDEGSVRNEDAFFDGYTTEGILISDLLFWGFDDTAISFVDPDSLDGGSATLRGDIVYMNIPSEATLIFERESIDTYRCTAVYLDDIRLDEAAQNTFLSDLYDAVQWDYPDYDDDLDEDTLIEKSL